MKYLLILNINKYKGDVTMNDKTKIVKVRKNNQGDITDVMLQDGNVYAIEDAIMMAKDHRIEGVNVGKARNGREYLRSNPNEDKSDNLDNISTFE
jgi:hypothetical protein